MNPLFFITDRRHGNARAAGSLERLLHKRGWPKSVATAEQIHSANVVIVEKLKGSKKHRGADGLLTEQAGQPLAIFTADCVPVFLQAGPQVTGLLHAGWRGVQKGILERAVQLIRRRWGIPARQISYWLGPSIGKCCFEVQWDVARHFPLSRLRRKDRWTVDLASELKRRGRRLGLTFRLHGGPKTCTMHSRRFHSHRRNGTTDRQASVIMRGAH